MRPIDADKLLEQFCKKNIQMTFDLPVEEMLGQYVDIEDFSMLVQDAIQAYRKMVIDTIKNQPTAYDVDKVVEQLKDKSVISRPVGWTRSYEIVTLNDAIEIVKFGGITD